MKEKTVKIPLEAIIKLQLKKEEELRRTMAEKERKYREDIDSLNSEIKRLKAYIKSDQYSYDKGEIKKMRKDKAFEELVSENYRLRRNVSELSFQVGKLRIELMSKNK